MGVRNSANPTVAATECDERRPLKLRTHHRRTPDLCRSGEPHCPIGRLIGPASPLTVDRRARRQKGRSLGQGGESSLSNQPLVLLSSDDSQVVSRLDEPGPPDQSSSRTRREVVLRDTEQFGRRLHVSLSRSVVIHRGTYRRWPYRCASSRTGASGPGRRRLSRRPGDLLPERPVDGGAGWPAPSRTFPPRVVAAVRSEVGLRRRCGAGLRQ